MLHAVILYSVGSPDTLKVPCLRRYLKAFLSDKLVVQMPAFLWKPILHSFILRTRPHRLIKRYEQIFVDGHNPYLTTMESLCSSLENHLNHTSQTAPTAGGAKSPSEPEQFIVRAGYAYCAPSLEESVRACLAAGAERLTVLPLFPQYSLTTSKSPELELRALQKSGLAVPVHFVASYAQEPLYIEALGAQIKQSLGLAAGQSMDEFLSERGARLVLSYHGLPQSYIKQGEPYLEECKATTRALSQSLALSEQNLHVAFHSRMGPMQWLKPYLEDEVEALLRQRVSNIFVITPGFAVDCLETLYDINIKLKERFLSQGGESFTYIPALNAAPSQVALLAKLVESAPLLS